MRVCCQGKRKSGKPIRDKDWPNAPSESYSKVRGPIFGKCDGVPLVPVEVGLTATLAYEIDEQDATIEFSGGREQVADRERVC